MPQLKVYEAKESSHSWLPRDTHELLGVPDGRGQGPWYVVAHTAAEAIEHAQRAGIYVDNPRRLRVWGVGNNANMLRAHGHLTTPGEVIAHKSHTSSPVAKFTDNGWLIIGHFEYVHRERQIVFTPKEG
jgi:hypothetical protein